MMEVILYTIMGMGFALSIFIIPQCIKGMYDQIKHDMSTPGEWVE